LTLTPIEILIDPSNYRTANKVLRIEAAVGKKSQRGMNLSWPDQRLRSTAMETLTSLSSRRRLLLINLEAALRGSRCLWTSKLLIAIILQGLMPVTHLV